MYPRVLVIDDSAMLVELLVKTLLSAGFDASGATDLASMEAELAKATPELVLVDVNMPEMFGDDVIEFLRSQRKVAAKLLLYSDLPEPELAAKAKTSGADGYISKSAGVEGALSTIASALGVEVASKGAKGSAAPSPDAPPAPRKKRVLIVDDSPMTSGLIGAELIEKGFEVYTADSADKATRVILKKQTRPDLVLLDVRMPNVDGEQFCRFIKTNSLFAGIKVLLCSGADQKELQRICREAGADGYVAKDAVLGKVLAKELS